MIEIPPELMAWLRSEEVRCVDAEARRAAQGRDRFLSWRAVRRRGGGPVAIGDARCRRGDRLHDRVDPADDGVGRPRRRVRGGARGPGRPGGRGDRAGRVAVHARPAGLSHPPRLAEGGAAREIRDREDLGRAAERGDRGSGARPRRWRRCTSSSSPPSPPTGREPVAGAPSPRPAAALSRRGRAQ